MMNFIEDRLKQYWEGLTAGTQLSEQERSDAFARWLEVMDPWKRSYHNYYHVLKMLDLLEQHKSDIDNPKALAWAIWYHDFDTRKVLVDGIQRSIEAAQAWMDKAGLPREFCLRVSELIAASAEHSHAIDLDMAYFLDFDLAILGSWPEEYNIYLESVLSEYKRLPHWVSINKRKSFLRELCSRKHIFKTKKFRHELEARARNNLAAELALSGSWFKDYAIPTRCRKNAFAESKSAFDQDIMELLSHWHWSHTID